MHPASQGGKRKRETQGGRETDRGREEERERDALASNTVSRNKNKTLRV